MNDKGNWWRSYLRFVTNNPLIVILVVLAVTAFFGYSARTMKVINNNDLWLPHGNSYVDTTRVIEDVFGGKDIVVIGISPKQGDIYQPAVLTKIAHLQDNI